jgi:protein-L-isoaspartate(D-aspartate) O-methyltransferase
MAAIDFAMRLSELFGKLFFLWLIFVFVRIAETHLNAYKRRIFTSIRMAWFFRGLNMDYVVARNNMVESQVRVNDVTDMALQRAMRHVERERLCAQSQGFAAYGEVEAMIAPNRYLMKARDISKLMHVLSPKAGESVLAIAAPYAGAVLAHAGLNVIVQEEDARTLAVVEPYLKTLGVKTQAQAFASPVAGEYDLIIIEGAVSEVPDAWLKALKIGGRLGVVVRTSAVGKATVFTKLDSGVSAREVFDSSPSTLPGFEKAKSFVF